MIQHRIRFAAYGVAAAALSTALAACGGGSSGGQTVAPASGGGAATAALTTHSSSIGTVVADSNGRTIYELVGNPASNSKCDSSCQAIWPAVMSGGSVKVLHGHPLFTYSGDSAAGDTNGQNVTDQWGTWLALDKQGAPIPASGSSTSAPTAPASSPPASGGTGGYGY